MILRENGHHVILDSKKKMDWMFPKIYLGLNNILCLFFADWAFYVLCILHGEVILHLLVYMHIPKLKLDQNNPKNIQEKKKKVRKEEE